jgi:putative protease
VYLGLKTFNARMRSSNFAYSQFEGALRVLHRMGRKVYVTVNTVFEQREADRLYQLLKYLSGLGPDGIVVQDFGIITMARDNFPSLKLHASTQMNIASARGVNLLSRYGFSRVVLARELSLGEIREIRGNTNMELEVFVHGALCMSVSGLCLFSSYLGGKSANRGMCTQACRRYYYTEEGSSKGGYYFSPADLQLIEKIPDMVTAGVNSFKIEGRMKSADYVGTVVSAYRRVIDSLDSGEEGIRRAVQEAGEILRSDFARAKTVFLFNGLPAGSAAGAGAPAPGFEWLNPEQDGGTGIPLGKLLRVKGGAEERRGLIAAGPVLPAAGDSIRLHKADDSDRVSHKLRFVEAAEPGAAGRWLSIPEGFEPGDAVYLIQTRAMSKRYPHVVPYKLDGFKRSPGGDKAPLPDLPRQKNDPVPEGKRPEGKRAGKKPGGARPGFLPEGLYPMVSRIEDLYILQAGRPSRVILNYSFSLASRLLGTQKQPLPFSPGEIILSLDPFFPQSQDSRLAGDIPALMDRGYYQFIVNNPGHFSFFRNDSETLLIAGPWLYMFNRWAAVFLNDNGAEYFVSPLENNRQNLEKTIPAGAVSGRRKRAEAPVRGSPFEGPRSRVFLTVYSRPSLFRIRAGLGGVYGFGSFSGGKDESFHLAPSPEASLVFPEKPFSIVDKIPFLREAGFGRFILDLSSSPLKKALWRDIKEAAENASHLAGTVRFNWKDGFFQPPSHS